MTDMISGGGIDLDPEHAGAFIRSVGMYVDAASADEVRAHLEVTADHHTPWGVTHGGLYATVIESAASLGASLAVAEQGGFAVGVSNQTDFLRVHLSGRLDVVAHPVHQSKSMQLWSVEIADEKGKLIATGHVRLFNRSRMK